MLCTILSAFNLSHEAGLNVNSKLAENFFGNFLPSLFPMKLKCRDSSRCHDGENVNFWTAKLIGVYETTRSFPGFSFRSFTSSLIN